MYKSVQEVVMKILRTELVEQFMEERGLSKVEFSQMCGITQRELGKILNDDLTARFSTLARVAFAMGIQRYELFY